VKPAAPAAALEVPGAEYVSYDDGWPGYEEYSVDVK